MPTTETTAAERPLVAVSLVPGVVLINRGNSLDPNIFPGEGGRIIEQDPRSLVLHRVDLNQVHLRQTLEARGMMLGENRLGTLRSSGICLDAQVLQTILLLLKRPGFDFSLLPKRWVEAMRRNAVSISFDGTVFQDPYSSGKYVLYLCSLDGKFLWGRRWLAHSPFFPEFSAVLKN